jgi:uncharacterized membrane protein YccC
MTNSGWWWGMTLGGATGIVVGLLLGWLLARRRHAAQLRRASDEMEKKLAFGADQVRAVQARSQADLDQARAGFKRQLAAASEAPVAAMKQAEERLRAAYDEIDRMRRAALAADTGSSELSDGFAATRPMRDGM